MKRHVFPLAAAILVLGFATCVTNTGVADDSADFREKISELARKHRELYRSGEREAAREVLEEMQHLMREYGEVRRSRSAPVGISEEQRQRIEEIRERGDRVRELTLEISELRRDGNHEEAERLQREIGELMHRSSRPHHPEHAHGHEVRSEEQRIRHLHEAAENLAAAGLEEEAHEVRERAERMEHELREHIEREHQHHEQHVEHERQEKIEHAIHEIHEKMRVMHESIERLHKDMARLNDELHALKSNPRLKAPQKQVIREKVEKKEAEVERSDED